MITSSIKRFAVSILFIFFFLSLLFSACGSRRIDSPEYTESVGQTYMTIPELNCVGDTSGITASRSLELDFTYENYRPYYPMLTDSYILNNSGNEDKTVTVAYPFVQTFPAPHNGELKCSALHLRIDGEEISPQHYVSCLSDECVSGSIIWTVDNMGEKYTITEQLERYGFKTNLENGSYLDMALSADPILQREAYIYIIPEGGAQGESEPREQPSEDNSAMINMPVYEFIIDSEKTEFFAAYKDQLIVSTDENGRTVILTSKANLIVFSGEDAISAEKYLHHMEKDRAPLYGDYIEDRIETDADYTRVETDLEHAVEELSRFTMNGSNLYEYGDNNKRGEPFDIYSGKYKAAYVALQIKGEIADVDDLSRELERLTQQKNALIFFTSDVTIPAGGIVTVEAKYPADCAFKLYFSADSTYALDCTELELTIKKNDTVLLRETNTSAKLKRDTETLKLDPKNRQYYIAYAENSKLEFDESYWDNELLVDRLLINGY